MAIILIASVIPGGVPGGARWHALGYGILSALLGSWIPLPPAAFIAWGYGALMETIQWILPTRYAEAEDLVSNAVGVLIGLFGVWAWPRLRRRYFSRMTS